MKAYAASIKRLLFFVAMGGGIIILFVLVNNAAINLVTRGYIYGKADEAVSAEAALTAGAALLRNVDLCPLCKDSRDKAL